MEAPIAVWLRNANAVIKCQNEFDSNKLYQLITIFNTFQNVGIIFNLNY